MQTLFRIIVTALLTACAGCGLRDPLKFSESERQELEDLRRHSSNHRNVILVCVYRDYLETRPKPDYDLHHFKATVVRSYKGEWKVAEHIDLVHGTDSDVSEQVADADEGSLRFIFTNEHGGHEIGFNTEESLRYKPSLDRMFGSIFPGLGGHER